jgi:hypothetical protein
MDSKQTAWQHVAEADWAATYLAGSSAPTASRRQPPGGWHERGAGSDTL